MKDANDKKDDRHAKPARCRIRSDKKRIEKDVKVMLVNA